MRLMTKQQIQDLKDQFFAAGWQSHKKWVKQQEAKSKCKHGDDICELDLKNVS